MQCESGGIGRSAFLHLKIWLPTRNSRGPTRHKDEIEFGMLLDRVRQHHFIGNGGHDDAGDDRHMQIAMGIAGEPSGFWVVLDGLAPAFRAGIETDPPHCRTCDEADGKAGDDWCIRLELGKSRAGHQNCLTECDDEQHAAFRHMSAGDVPVGQARFAQERRAEIERRSGIFDNECRRPQDEPRVGRSKSPRQSKRQGEQEVKGYSQEIPDPRRIMPARQPDEHHRHQHAWHYAAFGIEPVRRPAGVDPQLPDDEKQDQRLERTKKRQVLDKPVRQLRDGRDKDEIKEQFDLGDARAVVLVADTEEGAAAFDGYCFDLRRTCGRASDDVRRGDAIPG
jgi:hypothetical protein